MTVSKTGLGLLLFALLAGCASAVHYAGDSAAYGSKTLREDVVKSIRNFEIGLNDCRQIEAVDSRIIDLKRRSNDGGLVSTEIWQVTACGVKKQYNVVLTDDGQGGTFINTNQR